MFRFLRCSCRYAVKNDKPAPANTPAPSMIKTRMIVLVISFCLIVPRNGTTIPNRIPCRNPKNPPASAASSSRRDDCALLDLHAARWPTRKAINHAIGVTQTTPGYPARETTATLIAQGMICRSGISKMTRRSSLAESVMFFPRLEIFFHADIQPHPASKSSRWDRV